MINTEAPKIARNALAPRARAAGHIPSCQRAMPTQRWNTSYLHLVGSPRAGASVAASYMEKPFRRLGDVAGNRMHFGRAVTANPCGIARVICQKLLQTL